MATTASGGSSGFRFLFFISLGLNLLTSGGSAMKYMLNMIRHLQFLMHIAIM